MKKLKAIDFKFFIGCPCVIKDSSEPIPSTIEGIDIHLDAVISERVNYCPSLVKPILRNMESLNREEVEHLNKLWPKTDTVDANILKNADMINYLTSIHVDVFGWVEQGLAIDASYSRN